VDGSDGTAVITEKEYQAIQKDAVESAVSDALDLLREATKQNRFEDNVLLDVDWFRRAKEVVS
jgi:hypothetical protein